MSLNSINFTTEDLAVLFKNSLVEIDDKKQERPPTENKSGAIDIDAIPDGWKWLGKNKKNTLVFVRYQEAIHLPEKQLAFLTKLLSACKLGPDDVAILNLHNYPTEQLKEVFNFFKPKTVLLFEVTPAEIGMPMNFPEFQVQAYRDALYVSSPSLETIEPDKDLKGKLWASLKKIYNL